MQLNIFMLTMTSIFLLSDYFSEENVVKGGKRVISTTVRPGTEFAEEISVLRTFEHPLYTRFPAVTYYYDIAILELGMCSVIKPHIRGFYILF